MQLLPTTALLALAAALLVAAQIPDPSQLPACVLNCTTTSAASTDCGTIGNVSCLCTSPAFTTAAGTCLQSCSAADQKTATTFQDQVCAAFGTGSSASASASGSVTPIPAPGPTESAPVPGASSPAAGGGSTPAASSPAPTQSGTGAARALSANAAAALLAAAALALAL